MAEIRPYWESDDGAVVIYNADCLEVLPQLLDGSADLILCDPPYGHNNNNGDLIQAIHAMPGDLYRPSNPNDARPIANDGAEANGLFHDCLPEFRRLLKPGCCCCCCCCGGGGPDPQFARWSLWLDEVFDFKQMVVWDKGPIGMGWHYRRSYETVLVGQVPGAACKWHDETDAVENIIRHIRKRIPTATDHPTPKPVALMEHFIRLHSQQGEAVLDPFAGHAPVGVAAARLGRKYLGIEIDESYCRVAVSRIKKALAQPMLDLGVAR